MLSTITKQAITNAWHGFFYRCPSCHNRSIYKSYLKIVDHCPHCGTALSIYPADDAPPYIVMSFILFFIVPFAFYTGYAWDISYYLQFFMWSLITTLMILVLLPSVKGSIVGILWTLGIKDE